MAIENPCHNDPLGQKGNTLEGLSLINSVITVSEVSLYLKQSDMLYNRLSLPVLSKIGTFSRFGNTYNSLGIGAKFCGRVGYVGTFASSFLDYKSWQSGEITGGLFVFRTGTNITALAAAVAAGGSAGGIIGGGIGTYGVMIEYAADKITQWCDEFTNSLNPFKF